MAKHREEYALLKATNLSMLEKIMFYNIPSFKKSHVPATHENLQEALRTRFKNLKAKLMIDDLQQAISHDNLKELHALLKKQLEELRATAAHIPDQMTILETRLYLLPFQLPAGHDEQLDENGLAQIELLSPRGVKSRIKPSFKTIIALRS